MTAPLLDRARLELHILASLARSQRALARIVEAVADQVEDSKQATGKMIENLEMISAYQRVLVVKISGMRPRTLKKGSPAPPWLAGNLSPLHQQSGMHQSPAEAIKQKGITRPNLSFPNAEIQCKRDGRR
jgi:hypothetical protein